MGIIEQAARRLEELRKSGIEAPGPAALRSAAERGSRRTAPVVRERPPRRRPRLLEGLQHRPPGSGPAGRDGLSHARRRPAPDRERIPHRQAPAARPRVRKSAAAAERANLIMVTSSEPGEGKTFVSVNLAISIAMELDTKVLLVDADAARPAVLNRLGLPPSRGLLDAAGRSFARSGRRAAAYQHRKAHTASSRYAAGS